MHRINGIRELTNFCNWLINGCWPPLRICIDLGDSSLSHTSACKDQLTISTFCHSFHLLDLHEEKREKQTRCAIGWSTTLILTSKTQKERLLSWKTKATLRALLSQLELKMSPSVLHPHVSNSAYFQVVMLMIVICIPGIVHTIREAQDTEISMGYE